MSVKTTRRMIHDLNNQDNQLHSHYVQEYLEMIGEKRLPPLWKMRNSIDGFQIYPNGPVFDHTGMTRKEIENSYITIGFDFYETCPI